MKKVEEVKAILSRKYPEGVPLGKLLEEMAEEFLEKHSPERKQKRRKKRRAKQGEREQESKENKCNSRNKIKRSRHIPQALQDEVYAPRRRPLRIHKSGWRKMQFHLEP
jgi:hypothetical protein